MYVMLGISLKQEWNYRLSGAWVIAELLAIVMMLSLSPHSHLIKASKCEESR